MGQWIVGPGQGLPWPQALYPPLLWTTPFTAPTNKIALSAGKAVRIPAGFWIVEGGENTWIQWLDPVSREWRTSALPSGPAANNWWAKWGTIVGSDGFNFRVANLSGAATGARVTAGGNGQYRNGSTFVVATNHPSRWRAIVGGALANPEIIDGGDNYTLPPTVFVPAPKFGRPAYGKAVLGTGDDADKVVRIDWLDRGAGYETPPAILMIPDLFDPNYLAFEDPVREPGFVTPERIRNARARVELTSHGQVTAVFLENFGRPLASGTTLPTLQITGEGTGAMAVAFGIPQVPDPQLPDAPATSAIVRPPDDDVVTIQPSYGT